MRPPSMSLALQAAFIASIACQITRRDSLAVLLALLAEQARLARVVPLEPEWAGLTYVSRALPATPAQDRIAAR